MSEALELEETDEEIVLIEDVEVDYRSNGTNREVTTGTIQR